MRRRNLASAPSTSLASLAHRLADDRELSSSRLPADVRESEKVECLRLSFSPLPPFLRCMSPKLDQSSLFPMQFQFELAQSRAQFTLKSLGVCSMLKATTKSSAYRTRIIAPRASRFRHCCAHRSNT